MSMNIKTQRIANSSYAKLFFPCSENGADVNPVDVIRGCVSALSGVNAGNGLRVVQTTQAGSTTVTGATLPTLLASDSCLLFVVAGTLEVDGFSGTNICYGDRTASIGIRLLTTFGSTSCTVNFGISSITFTNVTAAIPYSAGYGATVYGIGILIDKTARTAKLFINGVQKGDTMPITAAQAAIAFNPAVNEIDCDNCHEYSYQFYVFPSGAPSDVAEAQVYMSAQHNLGNKVGWDAWCKL